MGVRWSNIPIPESYVVALAAAPYFIYQTGRDEYARYRSRVRRYV